MKVDMKYKIGHVLINALFMATITSVQGGIQDRCVSVHVPLPAGITVCGGAPVAKL